MGKCIHALNRLFWKRGFWPSMFELTQNDILCIMVSLAMRYSISYKQDAEEIERVWRLEEAKSYSYRRVAKVEDSQKSVESKVFEDDGVGHVERRYRPWHIGLRAALRGVFLFYGSFDIALLVVADVCSIAHGCV